MCGGNDKGVREFKMVTLMDFISYFLSPRFQGEKLAGVKKEFTSRKVLVKICGNFLWFS
jgi:hypothetical protein